MLKKTNSTTRFGVLGFLIGVIAVPFSTLGLSIAFVEFLRPVLIPGIDFLWLFYESFDKKAMILGFILNGLIYSVLFMFLRLTIKSTINKKHKTLLVILIFLVFLLITGMASDLYLWLLSPNKSWILQLGA